MATQHNLAIATPDVDQSNHLEKAVDGYEVSDIREEGASALADWMTKLLLNKEFQLVPANNLQAIFSRLTPMSYKADTAIIEQGNSGEYFFIITSGRCVVTRELPMDRGSVKLAELTVGDTFGEEALITDATRQATVSMVTDGAVMRLNKADFLELLSQPIVTIVDSDHANQVIADGGTWLNVDFAESAGEPLPDNTLRIPMYLLRLKLDQLDAKTQYVVLSRNSSHARAAAHILRQYNYEVCVLSD